MTQDKKIAVIGDGSWATALIKLLSNHSNNVLWYIREKSISESIKNFQRNPLYLSSVKIDLAKISLTNEIKDVDDFADIIIFVVPSVYFLGTVEKLNFELLKDKIIISAIKGIIPENKMIISDYFASRNLNQDKYFNISGPCHAEEVALERLSYLTISGKNQVLSGDIAGLLSCRYINTTIGNDVKGIEYTATMKNIYSIAAGVCKSQGFGDNFQAILLSNAIREMKKFLDIIDLNDRNILSSVYIGDLAVTMYSQFSRNRNLGLMLGSGYSVKSAQLEMNMIAEGYYGTKSIKSIATEKGIDLPIVNAVYNILYEGISPFIEISLLTEKLN
ncbi:MAG: NAD(P)H-dependent glycerol-3-phosphate dehydrogenase [Bacteroidota bacterium]